MEISDSKEYVLVKFSKDWADEFSAEGFTIYEKEMWQQIEKFVEDNPDREITFYFGTNEGWDDIAISEIMEECKVHNITPSFARVLLTVFDLGPHYYGVEKEFMLYRDFGQFPAFDSWMEEALEEEV